MKNMPQTLKARHLVPGMSIGVVATSEPVDPDLLEKGVEFLSGEGFEVVLGRSIHRRAGYLAGSDPERSADFNGFVNDPAIDAIFCAAGGANSGRLLPMLDYDALRRSPKVILGLSDPTVLLGAIQARTGLVTFHGPVVTYNMSAPMSGYTDGYFRKALFCSEPVGAIAEVGRDHVLRDGAGRGKLLGGNLTSLQQLLGTPYEPQWEGSILFWEDICEQPHSLDAKLTHLRNAGVLQKLSGMIVGVLESCDEKDYEDAPGIERIVLELCKDYDFPILKNVFLGHTNDKLTLPIGARASINSDRGVLILEESGVL